MVLQAARADSLVSSDLRPKLDIGRANSHTRVAMLASLDRPSPRSWAIGLGIGTAAFHLVTAPSGLFWLDAGDFATAGFELGVPHPTGFPLYTLLAKAACLLPIGSAGFKVAALSAALAGLVTGLLTLLLARLLPDGQRASLPWLASGAALVLWAGDLGALVGRTPDVYGLHLALLVAVLLAVMRVQRERSFGSVWLCGLAIGLGTSNHAEFRLFGPLLFVALVLELRKPLVAGGRRLAERLATAIGGLVVGLVPYLYLPLATRHGPYHVWGEPNTLGRFWDHVTARSIRLGFSDQFLNLGWLQLYDAATRLGGQLVDQLGVLLLFAPIGTFWLARRRGDLALVATGLIVVDIGYALVINPMGLADLQNGAPSALILASLGVLGVMASLSWVRLPEPIGRPLKGVALLLVCALVAGLAATPRRVFLNGTWGGEDLTFDALNGAPEGALVLTATEHLVAARVYWVGVGALRPDVQAVNLTELTDSRLLLQRHREGPFPLDDEASVMRWADWGPGASAATYADRIDRLTRRALADGRSVLWDSGSAADASGRWQNIALGFPLHRLTDSTQPVALGELPSVAPARHATLAKDPWGVVWLAQYWNWVGTFLYHRSEFAESVVAFRQAHELRPDWSKPLVNLGVLAARGQDWQLARDFARAAVTADPLNVTAWLNLSRYHCLLADVQAARGALERGRELGADARRIRDVARFIRRCPPEGP